MCTVFFECVCEDGHSGMMRINDRYLLDFLVREEFDVRGIQQFSGRQDNIVFLDNVFSREVVLGVFQVDGFYREEELDYLGVRLEPEAAQEHCSDQFLAAVEDRVQCACVIDKKLHPSG